MAIDFDEGIRIVSPVCKPQRKSAFEHAKAITEKFKSS